MKHVHLLQRKHSYFLEAQQDSRTREINTMSSSSWLVNALCLPTKTMILMGRDKVLTNHDKDDVALCHMF